MGIGGGRMGSLDGDLLALGPGPLDLQEAWPGETNLDTGGELSKTAQNLWFIADVSDARMQV